MDTKIECSRERLWVKAFRICESCKKEFKEQENQIFECEQCKAELIIRDILVSARVESVS